MAIVVSERKPSRDAVDKTSLTYKFYVRGTSDTQEAIDAVKQHISVNIRPPTGMAAGLPRATMISPETTTPAIALIDVEVDYARSGTASVNIVPRRPTDVNSTFETFNFSVGNSITMLASESSDSYGDDAPDFKNAINVEYDSSGNPDVRGVDIEGVSGTFAITAILSSVSDVYKRQLMRAIGKTNSSAFRGYSADEVRFMGVSGAPTDEKVIRWELTYTFAVSETQSITLATSTGDVTFTKKGWEYVWPYFEYQKDTTAKILVKQPKNIYVHQIYKSTSFSFIKLGSG